VADRILAVCGEQAVHALRLYDNFLAELSKSQVRAKLDSIGEAQRQEEPFRRLKDEGHHFSWRLMKLFHQTYDVSHPIHRLMLL
jgi:hypothetical protein